MDKERSRSYLYWFDEEDFGRARRILESQGYHLRQTLLTPCQVLKSSGNRLVYAPPAVWSRVCVRQGSWYRSSDRRGQTMLVSDHRLSQELEPFFDASMRVSDFLPERLPGERELEEVVDSPAYRRGRPADWEAIGLKDAVMFKTLFSMTGFWGRGDNLNRHWLTQKANHANFLAHRFTTRLDGEEVPYSISENAGVCSSCVEFFNVVQRDQRKLVRACPGAVIFGGVQRDVYFDLQPAGDGIGSDEVRDAEGD